MKFPWTYAPHGVKGDKKKKSFLAKLNCPRPFEKKLPTGVSFIAGKVSFCLGATSLTFRLNCFRMPLILDVVDAFLALIHPRL